MTTTNEPDDFTVAARKLQECYEDLDRAGIAHGTIVAALSAIFTGRTTAARR